MKTNRIVRIEYEGQWAKVFYKVPKGKKVYSVYVYKTDVIDGKVRSFFFLAE